MQNENIFLFNCINRLKKDYYDFSSEYSLNDLDHFDCCMYIQNYQFIIDKIVKKLSDQKFMELNFYLEDLMLKELSFFVSIKEQIEQKRIEKSIVKIPLLLNLFSEN